jgi:hypothetical protein
MPEYVQVGIVPLDDDEPEGMCATEADLKKAASKFLAEEILPNHITASKGSPNIRVDMKCYKIVRASASDYWYGQMSYVELGGQSVLYDMNDIADRVEVSVLSTRLPYNPTWQEIIGLLAIANS